MRRQHQSNPLTQCISTKSKGSQLIIHKINSSTFCYSDQLHSSFSIDETFSKYYLRLTNRLWMYCLQITHSRQLFYMFVKIVSILKTPCTQCALHLTHFNEVNLLLPVNLCFVLEENRKVERVFGD